MRKLSAHPQKRDFGARHKAFEKFKKLKAILRKHTQIGCERKKRGFSFRRKAF